ncbi:MAG TPA: 23S rRNA (uracil(1939)-C(5))-methyltransferase RlmD [Gammaproteobacteria bacterium]|nr:23S rRNA (uracil(1939)-C(5))-methyltransferase RlmD [Gammaproteobacteria bacterium]
MSRSRAAGGAAVQAVPVTVTALSHDGRGIARLAGKTVFIEDALPGEEVTFRLRRRHKDYDEARIEILLKASPQRVTPRCAHFGVCGGCSLQHLEPAAQIAAKQQTLLDNLRRIGGLEPAELLEPLTGPVWGYRRRARLSAHKNGERVFVGFKERHRPLVADIKHCDVLDPKVGGMIAAIGELLSSLSIADRVPQLEVAVGDEVMVMSIRVLSHPSDEDRAKLAAFEDRHSVRIYLQPGRADSVMPLRGGGANLYYRLPESGVAIHFRPADFTQVNGEINRRLVELTLQELAVEPADHVLDLFCGLGNFTLPLARIAGQVTGVEGEVELVQRACKNAESNGIDNVDFHQADLFAEDIDGTWAKQRYQHILLDPPRAGAKEIIAHFPRFGAQKIVYVSCHPATLARDAKTLVAEQGWRLARAGVLDMFPHTSHVESIAVFERSKP